MALTSRRDAIYMYYLSRYPRLTFAMLMLAPPLLLLVLLALHVIPAFPFTKLARVIPAPLPNVYRVPFQLSSDPYTGGVGQHQTEVEPDSYSYGSTIVAAFQVGRFSDGGSVNIGWASREAEITLRVWQYWSTSRRMEGKHGVNLSESSMVAARISTKTGLCAIIPPPAHSTVTVMSSGTMIRKVALS